jgi:hypothetical protein
MSSQSKARKTKTCQRRMARAGHELQKLKANFWCCA